MTSIATLLGINSSNTEDNNNELINKYNYKVFNS